MNVVGYVRVSTGEQADSGAGLLAQRAAITEECRRRGWSLVAIHSDTASARSLAARPGLAAVLSDIDRGAARALVVAKLDRLSRSLLDFSGLMEKSRKRGWALVALDLGVEPTTPAGEMMASVLATFAQCERRLIGLRTKEALAIKRIIVLAIATGLRLNELRSLQWPEDFDIRRGFVYVRDRAAKTETSVRTVPVDPKAIAFVEAYILDHRPSQRPGQLFLSRHGDPLTYDGFSAIFRHLRARLPAEIDFKIHRARNTAITNWLRSGTDLYTTMHLAGHKSPKVTERYAGKLTDEELARMARPAFSNDLREEGRVVTRMKSPGLGRDHLAILKAENPEIVRKSRRGASSAVEQGTFNPLVVGSNPSPLTVR